MNFTERLTETQSRQNSVLCVGLDVDASLLPAALPPDAEGVIEFNRQIIGATQDLVCAYKINLAFYEALGETGWGVLRKTLGLIPKDIVTIGDGKRGDIGNTSERYARVIFRDLGFDAATVNPYMGYDSVEPFLRDEERGAFVLALTSNPGSQDFQRLRVSSRRLFEKIAIAARKWNKRKNVGLVVGATHPREIKSVRALVPAMPLLIPGVGRQGGDLNAAVRYGCTASGFGVVINASRSIIFASKEIDFAGAAREKAIKLRDEIRTIQARHIR
ncbi:MAG: orotidine-5'-phosphate decarboxylase [Ignavibacteriales bacterium]|nr:orotidine-5'-phosphate decarboxylase [Ignavibacteriales bacterium]